jgi:hypothetical protein
MCDHPQHALIPDRIAHLTKGKTTRVQITCCEEDDGHLVVEDSWAIWDKQLQEHVHEEGMGNEVCNECEGPLTEIDFDVINAEAVKDARDAIISEHQRLSSMLEQPLEKGPQLVSGPGPASRAWLKEVCGHCGAEGPLIDAYSEYDPTTLTHDLTTTFDKGHYCRACDGDTRPKTERLSNHEVMALVPDIKARIAKLEQELAEFDRWVVAHAAEYCVNAEWIEKIAKAAGCPEQVCTA